MSGLDYAINLNYDPHQGRFTQVDPIEMDSVDFENPQTLSLYVYCANDPINSIDPSGLGFFSWLKKIFKKIIRAFVHAVIVGVIAFAMSGSFGAALAMFASDFLTQLGWQNRGWRTFKTPPTFPAGGVTLSQILQGTILSRVFGGTRGTPTWNPNAGQNSALDLYIARLQQLQGEDVPEDGILRIYINAPKWRDRLAGGFAAFLFSVGNAFNRVISDENLFDSITVNGDQITLTKNRNKFDVCDVFDAATAAKAANPETWPTVKFATGVGLGVAAQEVGLAGAHLNPDLAYFALYQKCNTARICCVTKQCPCTVKKF